MEKKQKTKVACVLFHTMYEIVRMRAQFIIVCFLYYLVPFFYFGV